MRTKFAAFGALVLAFLFSEMVSAQSVPPLVNYQGRLTGQTGAFLSAGAYVLQFRLWDSPTATNEAAGGDLIWCQQQNVTVQSNGVFNVILGASGGGSIGGTSPAVNNLAYAFAGSNCFLGVTIATSNGVSIPSPVEILPRQQLLSVPFAVTAANAGTAASALSLAPGFAGLIQNSNLPSEVISNANMGVGSVTLNTISPRQIGFSVGVGGLAMSASSGSFSTTSTTPVNVPNLSVTITTRGGPLYIQLISDGGSSMVQSGASGNNGPVFAAFLRDGAAICTKNYEVNSATATALPPSAFAMVDIPPQGTHVYQFQIWVENPGWTYSASVNYVKLIAFEF